ncbi:MAG TPA: HD domain-containing phosphohydrolase [Phycisphaerae bacterium]|nr:HD domain-containing phosphohydrolase [Phycisphaerae bacterium]
METFPVSPTSCANTEVHLNRGEALAALARVLDYVPNPGVPHHGRVAALAARVAARVRGADPCDTFYAALIHNVGLLDHQLDYTQLASPAEQANQPLMRSHPLTGAQLVATVPDLYRVAEIILDHHEWTNGHGYPRGKVGSEIGPAAQVLRFADTCDFVLREQGSPELMPLLDAVRTRTSAQVSAPVAEAGIEVLGESGFYTQLLTDHDVESLIQESIRDLAAGDFATTDAEITGLLELFAHVTDAHPADKIGHSRRVANLTVLVALALGAPPRETVNVRWAALLHDLGTIAVPKSLLDEPRLLSQEELAQIRRLTSRTREFLAGVSGLEDVVAIAASHGEAFDGSGSPQGLSGYEIPLGSRIIAVCDTFDALTSHRPYREARDTSLAIDILVRGSGLLFDPDVVSVAVPVFLIGQNAEARLPAGV